MLEKLPWFDVTVGDKKQTKKKIVSKAITQYNLLLEQNDTWLKRADKINIPMSQIIKCKHRNGRR